MSIINDALKKAEYFRKRKTFSPPDVLQAKEESPIALEEAPARTEETEAPQEQKPTELKIPSLQVQAEVKRKGHASLPAVWKSKPKARTSKIVLAAFLAGGCLAFLFGPWFYIWFNRSVAPSSSVSETASSIGANDTSKPIPPQFIPDSKRVLTGVLPLPRSMQGKTQGANYRLTGISTLSNQDHLAIINGKLVGVGEKIGKAEVVSIQEKEVVLKLGNKEFPLILE